MSYSRTITAVRENALLRRLLCAVPRLIALGFVLVLAVLVAELFRRVLSTNALDLIGVEPDSVFSTELVALTGQLYTDPHTPPFVLQAYGPLFPYLAWAVHQAVSAGTSLAGFYFAARIATCISVVAIMAGVGATLVRFLGVEPLLAAIASLLAGLVMFPWGYAIRPDSLYLAFLIWAVFAFHHFLAARSAWRLLPSIVLVLCAGYAKQTGFLFLPLFCLGGLWYLPNWKQRLLFLFGAAIIAVLSVALAPAYLWQNSAVGLGNGIDLRFAFEHVYWPLLIRDGFVIAAWLPCLLVVLLTQNRSLLPIALLGIYALALGTALGLKWGADINYYDEYLIFAIMLIAAALATVVRFWTGPAPVMLCLGSALLCFFVLTFAETQVRPALWRFATSLRIDDPDLVAIQRHVAAKPSSGLVADLADNGIGAFLPTRVAFAPFELTGSAAATGHLDLAPVQQAIRSGKICYAVTRRSWLAYIRQREDQRFPWWATPWAAPVLHQLLPLFEQDREFGDLVLMRNPVCTTG